jgi:hypothetical protein
MFADIWKAKVPEKVHIFAWRLVQEGLATQVNRRARRKQSVKSVENRMKQATMRL